LASGRGTAGAGDTVGAVAASMVVAATDSDAADTVVTVAAPMDVEPMPAEHVVTLVEHAVEPRQHAAALVAAPAADSAVAVMQAVAAATAAADTGKTLRY
jgi:hypothetical protein